MVVRSIRTLPLPVGVTDDVFMRMLCLAGDWDRVYLDRA
jgi:hypothetical protein